MARLQTTKVAKHLNRASAYSFTDEEVSQLANCNDQDEFLHFFQRILQSKGIDVTAFFDYTLTC